jgi:predicted naringenin-chalcone synthase
MVHAYLNEIGTAVPANESQQEFLDRLPRWISDPALVDKLRLIARRSGIRRRHTVIDFPFGEPGSGAFYEYGNFPSTGARMAMYQRTAPALAVKAAQALAGRGVDLATITHLVITSCTGFYAPGLDVDLIRLLNLPSNIRRTQIGFMGCYAGITGLRTASDIVRADPEARVLMVNLELSSLHLQEDAPMDRHVASLLFSDGCAASLISARPEGFRLDSFATGLSLADADKMAWTVEDQGFAMTLDAQIPDRIRDYLTRESEYFDRATSDGQSLWAIHPGGRAILDAVAKTLGLRPAQLVPARKVLELYGNMSSASVMFVFEEMLYASEALTPRPGAGLAFGPGLTIESMEFTQLPRCHRAPRSGGETDGHPAPEWFARI